MAATTRSGATDLVLWVPPKFRSLRGLKDFPRFGYLLGGVLTQGCAWLSEFEGASLNPQPYTLNPTPR